MGERTAGVQVEIANRKRKVLEVEIDDVDSVRAPLRASTASAALLASDATLAARLPHQAPDPTGVRFSDICHLLPLLAVEQTDKAGHVAVCSALLVPYA